MFSIIQDWRVSKKLRKYIENKELCKIADIRVEEIQKDFSHNKFLSNYQSFKSTVGENLSLDFTEELTLKGWLNSPTHAKALRTNYKYSCVRCLNRACVQIFSNLENGY